MRETDYSLFPILTLRQSVFRGELFHILQPPTRQNPRLFRGRCNYGHAGRWIVRVNVDDVRAHNRRIARLVECIVRADGTFPRIVLEINDRAANPKRILARTIRIRINRADVFLQNIPQRKGNLDAIVRRARAVILDQAVVVARQPALAAHVIAVCAQLAVIARNQIRLAIEADPTGCFAAALELATVGSRAGVIIPVQNIANKITAITGDVERTPAIEIVQLIVNDIVCLAVHRRYADGAAAHSDSVNGRVRSVE